MGGRERGGPLAEEEGRQATTAMRITPRASAAWRRIRTFVARGPPLSEDDLDRVLERVVVDGHEHAAVDERPRLAVQACFAHDAGLGLGIADVDVERGVAILGPILDAVFEPAGRNARADLEGQ